MAKRKKKKAKPKPKTTRITAKGKPPKKPVSLHPWRLCPAGEHWVREHERLIPVSEKNPDGTTSVRGHCRKNPSHKDQIYPDEIKEIAKKYFAELKGAPTLNALGFPKGNAYDDLIRGWTKYWNETLKPDEPLDPDLVKALIASESSFNSEAKIGKKDPARGLMQLRDSSRKILADEKGELRDHLVNMTEDDMVDPNINIAAGIRWLFRKRKIAAARLKRKASWDEAVEEFKGMLSKRLAKKPYNKKIMPKFRNFLGRLKK